MSETPKFTPSPLVAIGNGLYPIYRIVNIRREKWSPTKVVEVYVDSGESFVEHVPYAEARTAFERAWDAASSRTARQAAADDLYAVVRTLTQAQGWPGDSEAWAELFAAARDALAKAEGRS